MKNGYFENNDLDLLLSFTKWKLITSKNTDVSPVFPPKEYRKWVNNNMHSHSYREMFFVLSGEIYFSLNGNCFRCTPGTLLLIGKNETHDFYYPPFCKDFRHLWFGIAKDTIIMRPLIPFCNGQEQKTNKDSIVCRNYSALSFLRKWNHIAANANEGKLLVNAQDEDFVARLGLKYAWGSLITELLEHENFCSRNTAKIQRDSRKIIEAIAEHIRDTAGKDLDWDKLAGLSGYSKYHFARLFKQLIGQTVHDFINTCRRDRVIELIAENFNQKEIAYELGFSCPAAFSRWRRNQRLETNSIKRDAQSG